MTDLAYGVDVSHWQPPLDWSQAVDEGVSFAWAKATEADRYADPTFAAHTAQARAAGVAVGAYHFAQPARSSADLEAQWFRAHAARLDLPAALDMEAGWLASKQANTDWCLRWLDNVGETHRVLYTNRVGALTRLDSNRLAAEGVELWYAHPGVSLLSDPLDGVGSWPAAAVVQYGYRRLHDTAGELLPVDANAMAATTLAAYLGNTPPPPHTPEDAPMEMDFVLACHAFYLGVHADTGNIDERRSVDWWLWQLTSGAQSREQARSAFADTARHANPPTL